LVFTFSRGGYDWGGGGGGWAKGWLVFLETGLDHVGSEGALSLGGGSITGANLQDRDGCFTRLKTASEKAWGNT